MAIMEDRTNTQKYFHLKYVEYLEYLCRMAIIQHQDESTLEDKVYRMMEVIYGHHNILDIDRNQAQELSPEVDIRLVKLEG